MIDSGFQVGVITNDQGSQLVNTEFIRGVFADARVLPALIKVSRLFVHSVNYIYKKQLEEADILVINKIDLLDASQMEEVKQLVEKEYPGKTLIYQNSLKKESIQQWQSSLNDFKTPVRKSLELDYDIYGSGEAELAWLDADIEIYTTNQDAMKEGVELVDKIYSQINKQQLAIAHLKFFMNDRKRQRKISFTSIN